MAREASHVQPYSADLRERVLVACERGDFPQVEIARRFEVCPATVSNWRRQSARKADVLRSRTAAACPHAWMPRLSRCCVKLVLEDNDALLREYRERLAE